jgi:S-adenosylmethionine hydrolase
MITLTTDFSYRDPYIAEMKGVILTINSEAKIVDITHAIEKFDVRMGAFILASASQYFPKGTTHVAVVDPGVGTGRRAILIETNEGFLVGPDNGILALAAQKQGIKRVFQLVNPKLMLPKVSSTFHGRDIFAPAAAFLDKGVVPEEFGPEITDPTTPNYATVEEKGGSLNGTVLYIDGFGNIITNISEKLVSGFGTLKISLPNMIQKIVIFQTYAEAKIKDPFALIGSHGFLEIALNQGSAAEKFDAKIGDAVKVVPA